MSLIMFRHRGLRVRLGLAAAGLAALTAISSVAPAYAGPPTIGVGSAKGCVSEIGSIHVAEVCFAYPNPEYEHFSCAVQGNGGFDDALEPPLEGNTPGGQSSFSGTFQGLCTIGGVDDLYGLHQDDTIGAVRAIQFQLFVKQFIPAGGCVGWVGDGTLGWSLDGDYFQEHVKLDMIGSGAGGMSIAGISGSDGGGGVLPSIDTLIGAGVFIGYSRTDDDLPFSPPANVEQGLLPCFLADEGGAQLVFHMNANFGDLDRTPD